MGTIDAIPDTWKKCLADQWVSPSELYSVVRNTAGTLENGTIAKNEQAEIALADACLADAHPQTFESVEIWLGRTQYRISYIFQCDHKPGDGGTTIQVSSLERNGVVTFRSILVIKYSTYADDSDDHETSRSAGLFLVEDDDLSNEVFEAIRRMKGR